MILDEIAAHKREEIDACKKAVSLEALERRSATAEPPRDFTGALSRQGMGLIAEVKRASPSKGDIVPDVDAVALAALYEEAGARACSILTDQRYFKGSLDDLTAVHHGVALPCLRKEFVLDTYQVYEARAAGADAVLLIVRMLAGSQLMELLSLAQALGMSALVEIHSEEELDRAIEAGAHIVGINNRDLDALTVDLDTTLQLRRRVPNGCLVVSESGIETRDDVKRLEDCGVDAILVGTALLTSGDVRAKIQELLGYDQG